MIRTGALRAGAAADLFQCKRPPAACTIVLGGRAEPPDEGNKTGALAMKIAVISDSHDHVEHVEKAIDLINLSGAGILVHCGDICSPFMIERLARFAGQVHIVFGNNDGDRAAIMKFAAARSNVTVHGEMGEIETDEGTIAFTHRPEFGGGLAATGRYLAVFSGHTHRRLAECSGGTIHINPGELMGLFEEAGFALFDTVNGGVEHVDLSR